MMTIRASEHILHTSKITLVWQFIHSTMQSEISPVWFVPPNGNAR
ncbi:hypothetical protein [Bradyrhizobium sp. LHD-71]|jgi:hypothetical protein|nr:hypothetical protein [Bradyrhizobium sp. LHD-71]MDQ8726951.1 hypothetical protein [Bradyrhizobium sp. LHD-71]